MKDKNLILNTIAFGLAFGILFITIIYIFENCINKCDEEKTIIIPKVIIEKVEMINNEPEKTEISSYVVDEHKDELAIVLAKTVWGEARDLSRMEQAAVVWCALNIAESRYENPTYADVIESTIKENTFYGYREDNPYRTDHEEIARDVLDRYEAEKNGSLTVGRVLPKDYLYFVGDGLHNHFRNDFDNYDNEWDWSLPNPYVEE